MCDSTTTTNNNNNDSGDNNNNTKVCTECDRLESVDIEALVARALQLSHNSQKMNHPASHCFANSGGGGFNDHQQVFIAVGGTPGSGKSYIAHQVCEAINNRNPNGNSEISEAVVIGMDGYHLSQDLLRKQAVNKKERKIEADDGKSDWTFEDLMMRRGAPFTYCPKNFIDDLTQAKIDGEGSFPVYSREKHDPVPDGVHLHKNNKIVFVEGLYLLCLDHPDWKPLGDLWDDKWFIEVSSEETKKRLIERHLKTWNEEKTKQWGGNDAAAAERKADANDMKNAKFVVEGSRGNVDLIICNETVPEDDDNNPDCGAAAQ